MTIPRHPKLVDVVVTRDCVRLQSQRPRMIRERARRPVEGRVRGATPGMLAPGDSPGRDQARLRTESARGLGDGLSARPHARCVVAAKAGDDLVLNR